MIELKFSNPKEVYADNDYDGRRFEFPYSVKYVAPVPEKDKITQNKFIVSISNDLLGRWKFQNDNDLTKVIFGEFIFVKIKAKLIEENLGNTERLILRTTDVDNEKKYDPNKLPDFVDRPISVNLEELKRDKNKVTMGFQIPNKK